MSIKSKTDPRFLRALERGKLRGTFASVLWGAIQKRRSEDGLTLQALAKRLGTNKSEVSRWFSHSDGPNWTINTMANIADALDFDFRVEAIDRRTGEIVTPSGVQRINDSQQSPVTETRGTRPVISSDGVPLTGTR